jgi:hypothetical protein
MHFSIKYYLKNNYTLQITLLILKINFTSFIKKIIILVIGEVNEVSFF